MKNTIKFFGIIAFVAVIGFSMAACSGGGDDSGGGSPTKVVYKGMDAAANIYELTISKAANRAAFSPIAGDDYVMTVTPPNGAGKKSEGAVDQSVEGGYSLKPTGATKVFNVAVNGENMVAIAGEVKYTDSTTSTTPVGLLPPTASGDATISTSGGVTTFVSGATVYYDRRITNKAGAQAVTSFGYALSGDNEESFAGQDITQLASGSSFTITGGKLTAKFGAITNDIPLEDFSGDNFSTFTITPSDAKYFGEPDRPMVLVNKGGSLSTSATDVWGLICNKSDTEYVSIVYVDKDVTVKGVSEHDGTIDIMDITASAGWNFVFISKVGKYNVFTVSKRIPASYKWTVIDFNFPLDLGSGSDGGDHGGGGPGDGGDGDGDGE